jgi:hypothetical protein
MVSTGSKVVMIEVVLGPRLRMPTKKTPVAIAVAMMA